LFSKGYVFISSDLIDDKYVAELINQFIFFEKGSRTPDDGPDAVEGAIFILNQETKAQELPIVIKHQKQSKYRY